MEQGAAHRPSSERTPRRAQPRRDGRAAVPGRRAGQMRGLVIHGDFAVAHGRLLGQLPDAIRGNGARCGAHRPSSERTPRRAQPRRDGRAAVPGRRARGRCAASSFTAISPSRTAARPVARCDPRAAGGSARASPDALERAAGRSACRRQPARTWTSRSRESTSSAASIRSSRGSTRKKARWNGSARCSSAAWDRRRGPDYAELHAPDNAHAALAPAACPATHHSDPISV